MDDADAGFFEVDDFVADGEGDLACGVAAGDVVTDEAPLEDGDGAGEHAFDGAGGEGLGVGGPFDGHGVWAMDVAVDDGGLDATGAVALDPAVLGEDESVEELAEVFDHVVALEFAVDEDVDAEVFLDADAFGDFLADEGVVGFLGDLAVFELEAGLADFGGLREGADGCGGEWGEVEGGALVLLADGEGGMAACVFWAKGGEAGTDFWAVGVGVVAAGL